MELSIYQERANKLIVEVKPEDKDIWHFYCLVSDCAQGDNLVILPVPSEIVHMELFFGKMAT